MGLAASRQEAFWEACGFGHTCRAQQFIKDGEIDVNWVSYVNDSCPIHVASQGKPDIVDLLIANNCDVNAKDGRGSLAIHHAAMKGHSDIVQKLIDAGSEINIQEKNGWTALHNAAYWCHPDVVNILLKNNADVSIKNKDERTALHECARSQNTDDCKLGKVAKLLIDGGSDINAQSRDGGEAALTALMYAAFHNHPEVATALIDANCDIDAIDTTYWTALHWAAERGHEELVYILVEAGADPTKRDLKGETALDRATVDNIKEVLTSMTKLHKELQYVNSPIIQPVENLRKPMKPFKPKCDPKFKSKSLLPTDWIPKSNVKNLINERKSRLAAQTSQTYRNELARRTGTNVVEDNTVSKSEVIENSDACTDKTEPKDRSKSPVCGSEKQNEKETDLVDRQHDGDIDGGDKQTDENMDDILETKNQDTINDSIDDAIEVNGKDCDIDTDKSAESENKIQDCDSEPVCDGEKDVNEETEQIESLIKGVETVKVESNS